MARPTVGLFGLFDTPSLDDQVVLRVVRVELERRGAAVRAFAPFGSSRPIPFDGGEPVEALFPADAASVAELAESLGAVVLLADPGRVTPDALAALYGEPAAALAPVARLLVGGVDGVAALRLPPDPHPALLAPRAFPAGTLALRVAYMRALGWWPDGAPVVIEAGVPFAGDLPGGEVVLVRPDGGARGAAAGARELPAAATVDDLVAALAHASCVVAASPVLRGLARAYGRLPADAAADTGDAAAPLDGAFDDLVAAASGGGPRPERPGEAAALHSALDARERCLATERSVLADYVRALRNNAAGELAAAEDALAHLRRENELLRHPWRRARRAAARLLRGRPQDPSRAP